MTPRVDPEFRDLIPPLREDEREGLEASILSEGCRDPLVVWEEEGLLLDGHNRLSICEEHGLGYRTKVVSLPDREAARDWIEANALSRRNLTPDQIRMLRGSRYNRMKKRHGSEPGTNRRDRASGHDGQLQETTAEKLAQEHGVSERTIRRDGKAVEAIEDDAELTRDVVAGRVSLPEAARRSTLNKKIAAFPEDEREKAGAFLRRVVDNGNHTAKAVELADNLLEKPQEERVRIYVLDQSDDPQDQSLALTEAAGLPPMPHPALPHLRDASRAIAKAARHMDNPSDTVRLDGLRSQVSDIISSLKEHAA